jgi:hypothetical protein
MISEVQIIFYDVAQNGDHAYENFTRFGYKPDSKSSYIFGYLLELIIKFW